MQELQLGFVALVALLHVWFLVLETFLWTTPFALRRLGMSKSEAEATAVLAKNQGLYNGFLAAGLVWSLVADHVAMAHSLRVFFLACVIVAGVYGAWTAARQILFLQALPAAIAVALVLAPK
jgi:putative membrane protein